VKVFGIVNGVVWGFITGCFLKVVVLVFVIDVWGLCASSGM